MRNQRLTVAPVQKDDARFLAAMDVFAQHAGQSAPDEEYLACLSYWQKTLEHGEDKPRVLVARDGALYVGYILTHELFGIHLNVPERVIKSEVAAQLLRMPGVESEMVCIAPKDTVVAADVA